MSQIIPMSASLIQTQSDEISASLNLSKASAYKYGPVQPIRSFSFERSNRQQVNQLQHLRLHRGPVPVPEVEKSEIQGQARAQPSSKFQGRLEFKVKCQIQGQEGWGPS